MSSSTYGKWIVAAGIAFGLAAALIVAILVYGPMAVPDRYEQIIGVLGKVLIGAGIVLVLIIIFLGLGGPAKNLKLGFGKFNIETEGDNE